MMKHTPVAAGFDEEFRRSIKRLPGGDNAAVSATREQALEKFVRLGLPSTGLEEWKYTSLKPLSKRRFSVRAEPPAAPALAELLADADYGACRLVFVDGFADATLSSDALPQGVTVRNLAAELEAGRGRELLTRSDYDEQRAMVALNGAFLTDGALIDIAPGAAPEQALHLLFLASGAEQMAQYPRVLVQVGKGASVKIIEHYLGRTDAAYLTNAVSTISLAAGAQAAHYKVQDEGRQAFHVHNLIVDQARDSRMVSHSISIGAQLARHDLDFRLHERGAAAVLNGLYLADGDQHVDHHTRVEHICPHTSSEEDYRGVINERGHAVFNGKVLVHEDADKTDASQSNRNLLLSSKAEIDTKPELEIYAGDVKCSHGATVGQLDEQALFYLRSRGIEETTARALLVFAFADDLVHRIDIEPLRAQFEQRVLGRMPDAGKLEAFV